MVKMLTVNNLCFDDDTWKADCEVLIWLRYRELTSDFCNVTRLTLQISVWSPTSSLHVIILKSNGMESAIFNFEFVSVLFKSLKDMRHPLQESSFCNCSLLLCVSGVLIVFSKRVLLRKYEKPPKLNLSWTNVSDFILHDWFQSDLTRCNYLCNINHLYDIINTKYNYKQYRLCCYWFCA